MKNFIFGTLTGIWLTIFAYGLWTHFNGEVYPILIFGIFIPIFYFAID